jgi:lysophospholipase L1-like esterase
MYGKSIKTKYLLDFLTRRTAVLFIVVLLIFTSSQAWATDHDTWVATWGASPYSFLNLDNAGTPEPFENQTIRQILRISVGGEKLRIRLSNEMGETPLKIGAASVAIVDKESSIKQESLKMLTFGGYSSVTVPPGAPALSDPVEFQTNPLSTLAVSIYLPETTKPGTIHMGRIAYVSTPGNFTTSTEMPDSVKTTTMAFLTGIYITAPKETGVIVALGDSITDGAESTPYTFNDWPDHLAKRLLERTGENRDMAVINHGISGNQLLRNGLGFNILSRFDRDVLSTPGLSHIILLIGINDIGQGGTHLPWDTAPAPATPEDLIAGYRQLIARIHAFSPLIKIYGATLTPFKGTTIPEYYSSDKDKIREAVNQWIRTSGEFDAVIDFDKAIQDPQNPSMMIQEYDSGDKIHPNDAGYRKMANSIDLTLFK